MEKVYKQSNKIDFGGKKESLLMTTLVRSPLWLSGYIRNKKDVPMSAITVCVQTLNFWKFQKYFSQNSHAVHDGDLQVHK